MYTAILIAGFAGGVVRGLVGFIKYQFSYKNVAFNWPYFLGMAFLSGLVGVVSAAAIKELGANIFAVDAFGPALAVIIGYAGGDLLENVYKIILKKPAS